MLIETKCPNCGAKMHVEDTRDSLTCPYCGTQLVNLSERVVHDYENKPNLHVEFRASDPAVSLVLAIDEGNNSFLVKDGEKTDIFLEKGVHLAKFRIGKMSYKRTFVIREDNAPVNIRVSHNNGENQIFMQQPALSEVEQEAKTLRTEQEKQSGLGIAAFVFACTMFLSFIGVGLGIYDLVKGDPNRKHTFAKIAVIVGGIMTFVWIQSSLGEKCGGVEQDLSQGNLKLMLSGLRGLN